MKTGTSLILSLLLTLLLGGCINLDPLPDPTRYYVIGTSASPRLEQRGDGLRIGIREVSLPKYLESSRIALRKGRHELIYLPFERWGEDLAVSAARSIATTLEAQPGTRYVSLFPWPPVLDHDYVLRVQFAHFEGTMDGEVFVSGRWTLVDPSRNRMVTARAFAFPGRWDGRSYASLADALSGGLDNVGRQVAEVVAALPTEATTDTPSE